MDIINLISTDGTAQAILMLCVISGLTVAKAIRIL